MKGKFLCVMAQYDEQSQKKLAGIQKKLIAEGFTGKQTPDVPMHITLGTFPVEEEEFLIRKVEKASRNFEKFDIALNGIGLFGMEVLFASPAVNHTLLTLQAQFNNNYADGFGWTAHTTLLIDEPAVVHRAIPIAAKKFESFVGRIESIGLYEFWPTRFIINKPLQ